MYPHQAERLGSALERHGLAALIATTSANVAYVSGFRSLSRVIDRSSEVAAIFTRRGTALVVPIVDAAAAAADGADADHVVAHGDLFLDCPPRGGEPARRLREWPRRPTAVEGIGAALEGLGVQEGRLGIDEAHLSPEAWTALAGRLGTRAPVPAARIFAEVRMVKGPYEIECLDRALVIAEEGVNAAVQMLKPGITEREAAAVCEETIAKRGAIPCWSVVAMGDRTAFPAVAPSDKALRPGELVRLEVGCQWKGYRSVVGRTAVMGEPGSRHDTVSGAVQAGVEAATSAIRPGISAGEVHERAVRAVRDAGLGAYRMPGVGRGIGLEMVEAPVAGAGVATAFEPGMVLCLETPVYEVGWGGVQDLETVLVTRTGAQTLNRSRRGLVVLD
jgi:Xaa-Pro aminopeptidase